jgi:Tfp pilus assembly protein FimT
MLPATRAPAGFSLIDIMMSVAVLCIVASASVPSLMHVVNGVKLGQAQRDVYQEMQTARLIAVSSNRPIRIRFNCPSAGQYRLTELIGSPTRPDPSDSAPDRCSDTKWKYPANDNDPTTRPNRDGPVRWLPDTVTFETAAALEFWPDGTVHRQAGGESPWAQVSVAGGTVVTIAKNEIVKTISVSGLGKIQLVP